MKYFVLCAVLAAGCSDPSKSAPQPAPSAVPVVQAVVATAPPAVMDAGSPAGRLCVQEKALKGYGIATLSPDERGYFGPFTVALDERPVRLDHAGCFEAVTPGKHRITFYEKQGAFGSVAFAMNDHEELEVGGHARSWTVAPK